ncbi:MAG: pyocin activator PrtN family protein [Gammaproteobacteria bacterium]|nr:pyocin activator PrtN family protein [Gammaproteobacteria bacterium]
MTPTYFGLLAEFGESEIPLDRVSEKYFGLSIPKAKRRACLQQLPIPAYRAGSQKSPWLISAADLAKHIDQQRDIASKQWANMN